MPRPQMNAYKQQWKEFSNWVIKKHGYENLHIEKAKLTYKLFYKSRRRQDNDNRSPKFTNDSLVESGVIIDDDYLHIDPLIIYGCYDKENERMEIIIERLDL